MKIADSTRKFPDILFNKTFHFAESRKVEVLAVIEPPHICRQAWALNPSKKAKCSWSFELIT